MRNLAVAHSITMLQQNIEILPAVFTPMHADGSVFYGQISALYQRCKEAGLRGIFLNGTTGECMSLNAEERKKLLEAWVACRERDANPDFSIIVHVGSNNLHESAQMAEHAQAQGANGVAMVPTFYFRPKTLDELVDQCEYVASAAPGVPFYYYNIPALTSVNFPLVSFMESAGKRIRTFAGLKNSANDVVDHQRCLRYAGDKYTLYWGTDELFIIVYAAGNRHYVGSTYNFMSALYLKMLDCYHGSDFEQLLALQREATDIYEVLNDFHPLIAGKEIMRRIGVNCGPVRRPLGQLSSAASKSLLGRLQKTSFFAYSGTEKSKKNPETGAGAAQRL